MVSPYSAKSLTFPGTSALHFLFHPGMSNDELSVIQDVVTNKIVEEFRYLIAKLRRFLVEVFQ